MKLMTKIAKKHIRLEGRKYKEIPDLTPEKISNPEKIQNLILQEDLKNWKYNKKKDSLSKNLVFNNFNESMSFMNSIAIFAEKIQHHPEWFNVYNHVDIDLRTHDCDGVSFKDFYLGRYIDLVEEIVKEQKPDQLRKIVSVLEKDFLNSLV